jgi:hypothetical protein
MPSTETKTSIIIFNPEEGFLRVSTKPNTEIELSDAKHDFFVAAELINKIKIPVLADSRNFTNSDKEVRDFYASREMAENISAMAVLVASLSTRIVGNFFIKTSKPHFPTKLFTTETGAIVWLNEILKKEAEEKKSKALLT